MTLATDKYDNGYLPLYEPYLEKFKKQHRGNLLEVGIRKGGSMLLWSNTFPNFEIYGIDIDTLPKINNPRINMFKISQDDKPSIVQMSPLDGYDIIIDDGSHLGRMSEKTFDICWPLLKPGGLYVVEDWGCGYWSDWHDGRSFSPSRIRNFIYKVKLHFGLKTQTPGHYYGMVGFVKNLVDKVGVADLTRRTVDGTATQHTSIKRISFEPSLVFIEKKSE